MNEQQTVVRAAPVSPPQTDLGVAEPCSKRIGNNVQGQQAGPALGTDGYQDQKPLFTLLCRGDKTVADEQPYQLAENTWRSCLARKLLNIISYTLLI